MPRTLYTSVVDPEALGKLMTLEACGEGPELPSAEVPAEVLIRTSDGCADTPQKGTRAGVAALEGLERIEPIPDVDPADDGDWVGGTEYLPTAAFHERLYEAAIAKLAQVAAGYDFLVGVPFVKGPPGRPLGSVSHTPVQVCGDWVCPGLMGTVALRWRIVHEAAAEEADVPGPVEPFCGPEEPSGPPTRNDEDEAL